MEDFEFDEIDFEFESEEKDIFIKLNNNNIATCNVVYSNAKQLAKDIKIQKGETVFCNLNGQFVFGDFIGAFIQENNLRVKELTIISLSGGVENFEMFDELINKKWVKKINLMLSSYFLRTEKAKHTKTIETLKNIVLDKKDKFNVYYTNIHSKIILIETERGYVTIHGSANLRSSQSLEQICIQENKELYLFNYNYFKSLIPN